ncbi:MAG: FAD-dependent oxidoreductase [Runella slithyformis]|nr:MAG: FAD-dependent oxidoreductase [Runella slithyformis]TAF26610.1 MAG: FAD-dependent oxidoreductase [Runella slithyformis]TAF45378.1 MAG: FAD-dependent oxidoreductase [Runella slithyformis]
MGNIKLQISRTNLNPRGHGPPLRASLKPREPSTNYKPQTLNRTGGLAKMLPRRVFLKKLGGLGATLTFDSKNRMENTVQELDFDLIVVGAGTAGMPCAIAAAQKGAKVLVVEKAERVGGTLHYTGGHMSAGGTRHQAAKGVFGDTPQDHYQEIMRISKNTAVPYIVKLATDEAPKTIDWLDGLGFEFAPESPRIVYGHVPYTMARTQYGKDAGDSIFKAIKPLWDQLVASGNITVLLHTELKELIVESGKVTGVRVKDEGLKGKEKREKTPFTIYRSPFTILTTGGYGSNPDFFAKKHPKHPRLVSTAAATSTGEGIAIAEQIGAKFWNADTHISSLGGIETQPNSGNADFWTAWAMVFTTSYRPAREIYVNELGQRFMDESNPDPDYRERAVAEQPQKRFWVVFDEKALNTPPMTVVPKWSVEKIKQEAEQEKCAWVANSVAELATKTGLPAATLEATVGQFNQFCQNKVDAEYGRADLSHAVESGPFYAILTYATSLITFGGLAVNEQLQVLDNQNKPIPNLYAAGEILGAGATTGNAFCGGMLVTPAISFGRILGQRLG